MPELDICPSREGAMVNVIRLPDLLSKLVAKGGIPQQAAEEVESAYKLAQSHIKTALHKSCGLLLCKPGALPKNRTQTRIRVDILPGCPVGFESVTIKASDEEIAAAMLLANHRDDLEKVASGGLGLLKMYKKLASLSQGKLDGQLAQDESSTQSTTERAQYLLAWLNKTALKITREILLVKEDSMGAYFCDTSVRIGLYWAVIWLIAKLYGWQVQDLTIKVFAHECAHAFTQSGIDNDGEFWPAENFKQADLSVAEGLAQYYTHLTLDRLQQENSKLYAGSFRVYESLLPKQDRVYRVHRDWIDNYTPEVVRHAMLGFRKTRETQLKQFERRLSEAYGDFSISRGEAA